jgi:hypothetical protein
MFNIRPDCYKFILEIPNEAIQSHGINFRGIFETFKMEMQFIYGFNIRAVNIEGKGILVLGQR